MAVSKMHKCTILTLQGQKESLLKGLQELQSFEPVDLQTDSHLIDRLPQADQQDDFLERLTALDQKFQELQTAQSLLKAYAPKGDLKRYKLSYDQLLALQGDLAQRGTLEQTLALQKKEQDLAKKEEALKQKEALLSKWQNLSVFAKDKKWRHFSLFVGTLPQLAHDANLENLAAQEDLYLETLFSTDLERGIVVYAAKEDRSKVKSLLEAAQFSPFDYPYAQLPEAELLDVKAQLGQIQADKKNLQADLKALSQQINDLYLEEELVYNERERLKAGLLLDQGQEVVALTGYLPADKQLELVKLLDILLPKNTYVLLEDQLPEDEREIPIVLKNHPLVEPFELLTEMYSMPKYKEVDPTPYTMPFYVVFFGMMVADIGYGLLIWAYTLYTLKKGQAGPEMRKNMRMFHILSYPIMAWGLVFGSFFSFDIGFSLLSTSRDGLSILILSVVFGLLQLLFGLGINTVENLKKHDVSSALSDGLGWMALLIGAVFYVLGMQPGLTFLSGAGQYSLIAGAASIVIFTATGSKNKLLGLGSGLYKLYGVSAYIGDIASYTRLMALCVAGASIGAAFNQILGLLPPIARFSVGILLFIALQGLNFGLALLGAYVHGIRLMFVEFFGKFYEGGGRKQRPLKTYEKYVDIQKRQMEENS